MKSIIRTTTALTLLAGALSLGASTAQAQDKKLTPIQDAGRQEFNTYCVPCHGVDAKGQGVAAQALKDPPADLTLIAARRGGKFDTVEVAEIIDGRESMPIHGTREMPVWGKRLGEDASEASDEESLTQGRVALLVAYLEAIQEKAPADAGAAK